MQYIYIYHIEYPDLYTQQRVGARRASSCDSPLAKSPWLNVTAECGGRFSLTTRVMSHLHQELSLSSNKTRLLEENALLVAYTLLLHAHIHTANFIPLTFICPFKPLQMSNMVCVLLMFAAVIVPHAYGRPALPPLRVKGDHFCTCAEMQTRVCGG